MEIKEFGFVLERLISLVDIEIVWVQENKLHCFLENEEEYPLYKAEELRNLLMKKTDAQKISCLYCDDYGVYFCCIKAEQGYLLAGPMGTSPLSRFQIYKYGKLYHLEGNVKAPELFTIKKILEITRLLEKIITGNASTEEDLLIGNGIKIADDRELWEITLLQIEGELEERYHHTYMEERRLLECVEEGREDDALRLTNIMDASLGILSKDERNNQKNLAIAAITLCTRAAIAGGISPSEAYRLSDYYILKIDEAKDAGQIFISREQAIRKLAHRVRMRKENTKSTNYIAKCKDYVNKNYRKKIYAETIAEQIGISTSYLSHLFKSETGKSLQEYIIEVRIERAKNLLCYSEETLANIASYVNFPSQSYFGEKFKKYVHMTPTEYRRIHKPAEFYEKK